MAVVRGNVRVQSLIFWYDVHSKNCSVEKINTSCVSFQDSLERSTFTFKIFLTIYTTPSVKFALPRNHWRLRVMSDRGRWSV